MKYPLPESEKIEFKETLTQLDKGIKSLSAMLNRCGEGTVYFGIKDNGEIVGLNNIGKDTLQDIRQKVSNFIFPQVIISIKIITTSEDIKYIELSGKGSEVPYSYDGRYFIRTAASDEQLTPQNLRKLLESGDADLISNAASHIQDLTFEQFNKINLTIGLHPKNNHNYYESKGFYNKEGKFNLMAYLLSDQNNVSIKVVKFNGYDKASMSERTEYGYKCLLSSMQEVLDYFKSINITKVDLSEGKRKETPLFDYESFREAWINACLHNHWIDMTPPSVFMFDDRIEVFSYGDLPFGLSLDDFYFGMSKPINKSLKDIFVSLGYSEQSGHGVPIIVEKYGKEAFKMSSGTITVTIPYAYEPDYVVGRKAKESIIDRLTENQRKVLYYLVDNPYATQAQISSELEISIQGVKKIVARLQEHRLLSREGSKKDGRWLVTLY